MSMLSALAAAIFLVAFWLANRHVPGLNLSQLEATVAVAGVATLVFGLSSFRIFRNYPAYHAKRRLMADALVLATALSLLALVVAAATLLQRVLSAGTHTSVTAYGPGPRLGGENDGLGRQRLPRRI